MMQISIAVNPREWSDPQVLDAWRNLVHRSPHALYASPLWFEHLRQTADHRRVAIAICREREGSICGVAPLSRGRATLEYHIGQRCLGSRHLRAAHILGSEPPLPPAAFPDLCREIFRRWPECDCLYMDSMPQKSPFWESLRRAPGLLYVPDGLRPWHLIELGPTPEAYFDAMGAKTRSTLRRKRRHLDREVGTTRLVRVDAPEHVVDFVNHAMTVSHTSWQHRVLGTRIAPGDTASLRDLAGRGVLRSYLLMCGERPCAFVVGYQYAGTYYYNELAYDPSLGRHSPGTVLLHLIIEDLFAADRPELLDFGVGHAEYKARFGNLHTADGCVFLLAPTVENRLLRRTHALFRAGVRTVRRFVKR